jgi:anaerobic magnesium-protoporphyrin IX monomethyl ester cyclase
MIKSQNISEIRVLFINPPRFNNLPVIREDRCELINRYLINPPYSLIQLAAIVKEKGIKADVIDANCQNLTYKSVSEKINEFDPAIIIFRFTPATIEFDMRTADVAREINSKIITAGICWSLKSFADKIIREYSNLDVYITGGYGTYEESCLSLIESVRENKSFNLVPGICYMENDNIFSTSPAKQDFNSDPPIPSYDLLPHLKNYYISPKHSRHCPFTIMYTSSGCPYHCNYCTTRASVYQQRSIDNIVREILYLWEKYRIRCIFFMDEIFTYYKKYTIDLCNAISDLNIKLVWYTSTRVDKVDSELLYVMKKAGCKCISYGIESGNQEILDNIQKGITIGQAVEAVKLTKKAGMDVHLSFIIGLPGETRDTVSDTIRFVKKAKPVMAQFNTAVPFPDTPLYDIAVQNGWMKEMEDYKILCHQKAPMRNKDMTREEILRARKMAYKKLYFNPSWIFSQFKNLKEFSLILSYYIKCLKMFIYHKMEYSH